MVKEINKSTIDKALTMLEKISDYPNGISLSDISKITNIPKTTTFRILEILKTREYVTIDNISEKYILDIKSFELGMKGLMNINLVEVSIPFLKTLSNKTNETCFLGVYNSGYVIYLYKSEGTMSIQTNARLGSRIPAYCTGIGKALLAYQPLDEIESVLNGKLDKITDKTIVDKVDLYNILANVRLQGYAFDHEENEEGLTCIAKPIFNHTGSIVAAISVAGPTYRMTSKLNLVIEELNSVCQTVSRRLGYYSKKIN